MPQHKVRVARPVYRFVRNSRFSSGKNTSVKYVGPKARR